MNDLMLIVIVLLISGIVGGLINFFLVDPNVEKPLTWWQHALVGIGASFMVPLFLNMISSNLIDSILNNTGKPAELSKLFILAGFCLIAAVSSRAFIRTLSDKILQEVRDIRIKANEAQVEAADAKATVAPLIEMETNDNPSKQDSEKLLFIETQEELDGDEELVLKAFLTSDYIMRSLSGIAKDTGLNKSRVNALFSTLIQKGYIQQKDSDKGPKWYISATGRETVVNLLNQ